MVQQAVCRLSMAGAGRQVSCASRSEPSIPGNPAKGSAAFGTNPAQLPFTDEDQSVCKPMHKTKHTTKKLVIVIFFFNLFGLFLQVPQNLSESMSQTDRSTSSSV